MEAIKMKFFQRSVWMLLFSAMTVVAQAGVPIQHWVTSKGSRVYFVETHALPILDVQVDFAAGSVFDPAPKQGLAALTRGVLDLGAGARDESAVASGLADVGAILGGAADTDRASVSLRTLAAADKRDPALGIFLDVLQKPRFEAAIFEREKARTIAALKEAMTRPDSIAGKAFWDALYPGHPYGRQATPESLAALSIKDLQAFYRRYYVAPNAVISLVGDMDREAAEKLAEEISQGLPDGVAATLPAPPEMPAASEKSLSHPASQAHLYLGLPALVRGDPDFFPLVVGNYTLGGGGFVSRLMQEVREKRGYAYSVYSYFQPLRQSGPFQIGLQTKKSQAREALKVARETLEGFLAQGPTPSELAAAKANITGSFPLRLDSNRKLLDNIAVIGFYGLPLDWLEVYREKVMAVTAEEIKAAFARHVKIENLVTVIVGGE